MGIAYDDSSHYGVMIEIGESGDFHDGKTTGIAELLGRRSLFFDEDSLRKHLHCCMQSRNPGMRYDTITGALDSDAYLATFPRTQQAMDAILKAMDDGQPLRVWFAHSRAADEADRLLSALQRMDVSTRCTAICGVTPVSTIMCERNSWTDLPPRHVTGEEARQAAADFVSRLSGHPDAAPGERFVAARSAGSPFIARGKLTRDGDGNETLRHDDPPMWVTPPDQQGVRIRDTMDVDPDVMASRRILVEGPGHFGAEPRAWTLDDGGPKGESTPGTAPNR